MKKIKLMALTLIIIALSFQQAFADLYNDAIAAYRTGNYKAAEQYLIEALKNAPNDERFHYYLAITYVQQGRLSEASREYHLVMNLAPNTEASDKAAKGLQLLNENNPIIADVKQPTAMSSVLQTSPKKTVIPVIQNNNAIIVPNVMINNKLQVNFILDTGASFTSISRQTAYQLGLDLGSCQIINLKTANGIIKVQKVKLKSININGVEAKNIDVTIHDLPAAKNVTGLLGLSFLEQFIVTIDKKRSRIILETI